MVRSMFQPTLQGKFALILCTFGACLSLAACSTGQQVSYQSGGMTQTWEGGKEASKEFPLPIYPNSKASGEVSAKGDDDSSAFIILNSSDSVKQVSDYYIAELQKQGWKVTQMAPSISADLVNISAVKEGQQASVMVAPDEKKQTSISIALSSEPEGVPKVTDENYTPDKLNPPTD